MRIRFVTLYFPPEVGAAQRRISELAKRLAGMGHEITVLTGFPNYPSGIKPNQYLGKLFMKEKKDGYTIIRVPHLIAPNEGFLKRILIHITFAVTASIYSIFMKRDDIIYVESPPLFNGFIGLASKWLRRIPFYFNVADLWPQTAIELGALKNNFIIRLAQYLERLFYNQSDKILAVTAGIRDFVVVMGYDKEKVQLITNGVDHSIFRRDIEPNPEILIYKKENRRLAIYAGTHGMAHALDKILKAAFNLRHRNIDFLFVGNGAEKKSLLEHARKMNLDNVVFLDSKPQIDMPSVLRAADFAIISLRDLPLFDSAMPSKCFEALAAGLPVMLAVKGEMAEHIEKAKCGFVAYPENVDNISSAFSKFLDLSDDELSEMSRRGREYVVEHFSREKITYRLSNLMQKTVDNDQ
ncbi:MAG: glycosyltransferase family 4 protein [Candidatus Zixiibacteriota bacterium]